MHSHNHGVTGNIGGAAAWAANATGRTLPDWFAAAGYVTARFGKGVNGVPRDALTGWRYAFNATRGSGDPGGIRGLTDQAVKVIESNPAPTFIYFAPDHDWLDPEPKYASACRSMPFPMPPNFNEADVSDKRWRVRPLLTDAQIARIVERYRRSLQTMETIVDSIESLRAAFRDRPLFLIVVSDNGREDGQHRFSGGKGQHFEESIRVPLLFSGQGSSQACPRHWSIRSTSVRR